MDKKEMAKKLMAIISECSRECYDIGKNEGMSGLIGAVSVEANIASSIFDMIEVIGGWDFE